MLQYFWDPAKSPSVTVDTLIRKVATDVLLVFSGQTGERWLPLVATNNAGKIDVWVIE